MIRQIARLDRVGVERFIDEFGWGSSEVKQALWNRIWELTRLGKWSNF